MDQLKKVIEEELPKQHFDSLALGVVDFEKKSFEFVEYCEPNAFFDLASITKLFCLGMTYSLDPKSFSEDLKLTLEHRAGLPAWGLLSKDSWKEVIKSYSIKESGTLYSDYSALRTFLDWEEKTGKSMYELCSKIWDPDVLSWLDLKERMDAYSPITGWRQGEYISGDVHDDKAFIIKEKVSHAGLFGTIRGVCQTLLNWQNQCSILEKTKEAITKIPEGQRFVNGCDRVTDLENTLAGKGCGPHTFGHLGFTGTSVWMDPDKKRAYILLTNGTQSYWYDRAGLNALRRQLGKMVWELS